MGRRSVVEVGRHVQVYAADGGKLCSPYGFALVSVVARLGKGGNVMVRTGDAAGVAGCFQADAT